jgi:uridine kinase
MATSSGFVPVRQLVLVDLLSMVLGVRPGERAVVAVDTASAGGTARLCAELRALAAHVGGREMRTLALDDTEVHSAEALVTLFRAGDPIGPAMDAGEGSGAGESAGSSPTAPDAVLLVAGARLLRPALAARWDASVYVETEPSDAAAEHLYREQAPEHQATWVLDNRRQAAPTLTYGAVVEE